MRYRQWIARTLARAALADIGAGGGRDAAALRARLSAVVGGSPPWLDDVARDLAGLRTADWAQADLSSLATRIAALPALATAMRGRDDPEGRAPRLRRFILRPPRMRRPAQALADLDLPAFTTGGELAAWLGLDAARLDWLTNAAQAWRDDGRGGARPAQHYRCRWQAKAQGGQRLIEAPKADLKQVQRCLLDGLLARVPGHESAHGFVPGRSAASHAAAHVGQDVVLRVDLRDFFPSIRAAKVRAIWHALGYPKEVARLLTALTTTRTPRPALAALRAAGGADAQAARRLAASHLPQGAPTSPALANLCAFALDLRLDGLAWTFGARYTRYADDLVFSGPAALRVRVTPLLAWVAGIAADEGYTVHPRKTRCMPRHRQQRVAGIVVNHHPNLPRADYDRLKAQLHLCATRGPAGQNREGRPDLRAHLQGRIAWAAQLNPSRAAKLHALFARIPWPEPQG